MNLNLLCARQPILPQCRCHIPDAIELIHSSLGVALVSHGHEGVAFLGDVDVGDGPDLGEVVLEDVLGTGAVDAVDEELGASRHGKADRADSQIFEREITEQQNNQL